MPDGRAYVVASRHRDGVLVDEFQIVPKDAAAFMGQASRLPCAVGGKDLPEGALVLDLWDCDEIVGDPVTIQPEDVDWFLFEFLKMSRRSHRALVKSWRKRHEDMVGDSSHGGKGA